MALSRGAVLARETMLRRVLSQTALERLTGIIQPTISRILAGKKIPTLAEALALHRELGVPVEAWGTPGAGE